jgi:hypothetical protein
VLRACVIHGTYNRRKLSNISVVNLLQIQGMVARSELDDQCSYGVSTFAVYTSTGGHILVTLPLTITSYLNSVDETRVHVT